LRSGKTKTIGLILPIFPTCSWLKFAGKSRVRDQHGYSVILGFSDNDPVNRKVTFNLIAKQVDGVIFIAVVERNMTCALLDIKIQCGRGRRDVRLIWPMGSCWITSRRSKLPVT
jgi:DNA-binding LacI/PurR family transcriptional regulator